MDFHAGQIAFPGGRFEDSDVTVENTAFREIEEEIGVTRDKIRTARAAYRYLCATQQFPD